MRKLEISFLAALFMAIYFAGTRPQAPVFPPGARDAVSDGGGAYGQAVGAQPAQSAPEPASPGLPSRAAAPAARSDSPDGVFLERARAHYLHLKNSGHLSVDARVSPGTDPQYAHTPGYVVYDFARRRCDVFINAEAVRTSDFADEFSFRYMMYHELSHCGLYAEPRELRAFPALGARENRMLSDLVHLEFLHPSAAGRVNGYNTYHETYADIKALALLIAEGQPAGKIQSVVNYREGNTGSHMDSHDNAGVFSKVLAVPWGALDAARLEDKVRSLADSYIPVNFLDKVFHPDMVPFTASDLLTGSLRIPLSTLRFQYSDPEDLAFIKRRLAEVAEAPQAEWREYSKLALGDIDEKALINAFFKARYGRAPEELRAEDEALSRAVTPAARRP